jgi:hypothetical protein
VYLRAVRVSNHQCAQNAALSQIRTLVAMLSGGRSGNAAHLSCSFCTPAMLRVLEPAALQVAKRIEKLFDSDILAAILAALRCDTLAAFLASAHAADLAAPVATADAPNAAAGLLRPLFDPIEHIWGVLERRLMFTASTAGGGKASDAANTPDLPTHYRGSNVARELSVRRGYTFVPAFAGCEDMPEFLMALSQLVELRDAPRKGPHEWPRAAPAPALLLRRLLLSQLNRAAEGAASPSSVRIVLDTIRKQYADVYGHEHPTLGRRSMLAAIQELSGMLAMSGEDDTSVVVARKPRGFAAPLDALTSDERRRQLESFLRKAYVDCDASVVPGQHVQTQARGARSAARKAATQPGTNRAGGQATSTATGRDAAKRRIQAAKQTAPHQAPGAQPGADRSRQPAQQPASANARPTSTRRGPRQPAQGQGRTNYKSMPTLPQPHQQQRSDYSARAAPRPAPPQPGPVRERSREPRRPAGPVQGMYEQPYGQGRQQRAGAGRAAPYGHAAFDQPRATAPLLQPSRRDGPDARMRDDFGPAPGPAYDSFGIARGGPPRDAPSGLGSDPMGRSPYARRDSYAGLAYASALLDQPTYDPLPPRGGSVMDRDFDPLMPRHQRDDAQRRDAPFARPVMRDAPPLDRPHRGITAPPPDALYCKYNAPEPERDARGIGAMHDYSSSPQAGRYELQPGRRYDNTMRSSRSEAGSAAVQSHGGSYGGAARGGALYAGSRDVPRHGAYRVDPVYDDAVPSNNGQQQHQQQSMSAGFGNLQPGGGQRQQADSYVTEIPVAQAYSVVPASGVMQAQPGLMYSVQVSDRGHNAAAP